MRRWWLILVFCLLPTLSAFAQTDRTDVLSQCGHDPAALRTAIEAAGWKFDNLVQFNWSSTCRYLSMRLPSNQGKPGETIAWDASTNTQVGTIEGFSSGGDVTAGWDASGNYLVVTVHGVGTYLWDVPSNHQMLLNDDDCGLMDTHWDYDRHVIYSSSMFEVGNWCSPLIYVGGLRVYDLNTGATLAQYRARGYTMEYKFSDDGRYIIFADDVGVVKIIDRNSLQVLTTLNVNEGGGAIYSSDQIDLSPDGHSLAIGMNYLRVWDLTKPAAEIDTPIYRYPGPSGYIWKIKFVDNSIVETTTWDKATQRWNLATGAALP